MGTEKEEQMDGAGTEKREHLEEAEGITHMAKEAGPNA